MPGTPVVVCLQTWILFKGCLTHLVNRLQGSMYREGLALGVFMDQEGGPLNVRHGLKCCAPGEVGIGTHLTGWIAGMLRGQQVTAKIVAITKTVKVCR